MATDHKEHQLMTYEELIAEMKAEHALPVMVAAVDAMNEFARTCGEVDWQKVLGTATDGNEPRGTIRASG